MSNLDRDLAEAKRLGYGVWYGRYKADHPGEPVVKPEPEPEPEPVVEEKPPDAVCALCGKPFRKCKSHQNYCSWECSEEANRRRSNARYRRKAPITEKITCPVCGIVFLPTNRAQKYCGKVCSREAELEAKRAKYRRKTI